MTVLQAQESLESLPYAPHTNILCCIRSPHRIIHHNTSRHPQHRIERAKASWYRCLNPCNRVPAPSPAELPYTAFKPQQL